MILKAVDGLSSTSYDGRDAIAALEHAIHRQSVMITLALGGNVSVLYSSRRIPTLNHSHSSSLEMPLFGGAHASSGSTK